jgi:hypothetical protein
MKHYLLPAFTAIIFFFTSALNGLKAQNAVVIRDTVYIRTADDKRLLKQKMAEDARMRKQAVRSEYDGQRFGRNIISLNPFTVNHTGAGIGATYELLLGEEQRIGIVVPFGMTFAGLDDDWFIGDRGNDFTTYHLSPGMKLYVAGARRKVSYAIGPSIVLSKGSGDVKVWRNGYEELEYSERRGLGMIVNHYLNFQVTPGFNFGMDGGLGLRYFDRKITGGVEESRRMGVIGQYSIRFGFRL